MIFKLYEARNEEQFSKFLLYFKNYLETLNSTNKVAKCSNGLSEPLKINSYFSNKLFNIPNGLFIADVTVKLTQTFAMKIIINR